MQRRDVFKGLLGLLAGLPFIGKVFAEPPTPAGATGWAAWNPAGKKWEVTAVDYSEVYECSLTSRAIAILHDHCGFDQRLIGETHPDQIIQTLRMCNHCKSYAVMLSSAAQVNDGVRHLVHIYNIDASD